MLLSENTRNKKSKWCLDYFNSKIHFWVDLYLDGWQLWFTESVSAPSVHFYQYYSLTAVFEWEFLKSTLVDENPP